MAKPIAPTFRGLPRAGQAHVLILMVIAAAALTAEQLFARAEPSLDVALFAFTLLLCGTASFFEVFAPGHHSFQPNLVFFFWAAILLPPPALVLLAAVCFLPGRLRRGSRWYMIAFNIANYALSGAIAHELARFHGPLASFSGDDLGAIVGLVLAAVSFVAVNHLLIVLVILLAQGRPMSEALRVTRDGLQLDIALTMTGAVLAALWTTAPVFVVLAAGPMLLIYRALLVPMLTHKSQTDLKTGLFNYEHFMELLTDQLSAAGKHRGGFSVVMLDLDHLRAVNNRFGHLAGDRLIKGVADVLAEEVGPRGVAGRFGGEEFCILLPGASAAAARDLAESVRARVESTSFLQGEGTPDAEPLRVTISAGIASYPEHGETPEALLKAADAAVYDAKLGGRNRVRDALAADARQLLSIPTPGDAAWMPESQPAAPAPAPAPRPLAPISDVAPPALERRAGNGAVERSALGEVMLPPPALDGPAEEPEPAEPPTAHHGLHQGLIPFFVGALWAAVIAFVVLGDGARISSSPILFGGLAVSVVALDFVRIDIFERATISPATVPALVLAALFGPLGPIAAEALMLLARVGHDVAVRGEERDGRLLLRRAFDFGALAFAGGVAALVIQVISPPDGFALVAACLVAGLTYYAVNIGALAVVMSLDEGRPPVIVWRERLAWLWTHYLAFGVLAGMFIVSDEQLGLFVFAVFGLPVVMLWVAQKQYLDRSRSSVAELRRSHDALTEANARLRGLLEDNQALLTRMHRSYISTITSLARTIEAKDPYTGGHTERVALIAHHLAVELQFDEVALRAVDVGSVIHDIGKIGIPDQILLKPGKLTEEEFAAMKKHPEMSSYIIAELEMPSIVKQMVRSHHERYGGGGYPDGLVGEEIPLAARILTVADALDAMTSDRPYRKALPLSVARAEIEDQTGRQFCPLVVGALRACLDRGGMDFWDQEPEPVPAAAQGA